MAPSAVSDEKVVPTQSSRVTGSIKAESTQLHEEFQYLNLIREILDLGEHRPDRYALFNHYQSRADVPP